MRLAARNRRRKQTANGNGAGNGARHLSHASVAEMPQVENEPKPPFPRQHGRKPGLESNIRPRPEFMAPLYKSAAKLQGKVALITGGDSGIGRAVALGLRGEGWSVVIAGRRAEELRTTASIACGGPEMLVVPTDVGQPDAVRALFGRVVATYGRLDLLFNNAGTSAPAVPMEELTYEQWNNVVAVNLTGCFLCAQEAIKIMKAQEPRGGRIINNGSISAHAPRPRSAPYTATKHAITGLTKSISLDGRAHDIACGQIDIGNAATPMTERMAVGVLQPYGGVAPEPRLDLRHVVDAVLYMAKLPLEANVQFMTVMATKMPLIGRG